MFSIDQKKILLPYLVVALELSKKNCDHQKTVALAKQITQASDEKIFTLINFKDKQTSAIYESFCNLIEIYASSYSDIDAVTLPFVYQDLPIASRLSNPTFIEIREKAAIALLNMNLSIQQKIGVLTAFELISQSGSANGEFATASQLANFSENARKYLKDKIYFAEYGIHISEAAQEIMAQRNLLILKEYLAKLNAINHAATLAYQKLDEQYAQKLAAILQQIKQAFKKAKKKAIKKTIKNFEIGIAAMVATFCVAPYVSAFIAEAAEVGAMTGMEALLTSIAIDALAYSAVSAGTEAILNNNFTDFHKNFLQRAAVGFGTQLTGSLIAMHSTAPIVKGSTQSIKISSATAAVKNALQSILKNGKLDDALKAALLGGVTGATTDKLVSIFKNFEINNTMDELLKGALQEGMHASVEAAFFAIDKKGNHSSSYGCLVDILLATLVGFIAGNIQREVKNISERMEEEETSTHSSTEPSRKPLATQANKTPVTANSNNNQPTAKAELILKKEVQPIQKTPQNNIPLGGAQLSVPSVQIGKKLGHGGGLRFFDIADGRYINKQQLTQKISENNKKNNKPELGIALAHKFPAKTPRIYWLAEQQFEHENISVRPMVIGDEQTYFQAKVNPKTGRFKMELSANKNIRLNLANGEYDAGFAKLDYTLNAAEAYALANATLSQEQGLNLSAGLAVLGPNVTYSVKSKNQYAVLGLTFSGEISGTTAYGAGVDAGLGIAADKTQPKIRLYSKLGAFLGWGTKISSNILVGIDDNASIFEEVRNSPERKMIYESINEAKKRNAEWNPTSFFGKWVKINNDQALTDLEFERYEIDGNIAAGNLRITPVSQK